MLASASDKRIVKLPVREWCDALGITQMTLARRAGVTASVLSDYAHGCRIPTLKSVSALAKALDRTPEEFLTGPLPGEGLPTADDARAANLAWFRKVSPSQKARAALARTKPHK